MLFPAQSVCGLKYQLDNVSGVTYDSDPATSVLTEALPVVDIKKPITQVWPMLDLLER